MSENPLLQALGIKHLDAYWRALGRFVSDFAQVEANVNAALSKCAKVDTPIAQALFSGTRVDAGSNYIKRIAEAESWPTSKAEELDYIFAQLGEITRVRNDILHYGAKPLGHLWQLGAMNWLVSNERVAHVKERVRTTVVNPDILEAMSQDLLKIRAHILVLFWGDEDERPRRVFSRELAAPWRYKPERPSNGSQKTPRKPQKQQRQH